MDATSDNGMSTRSHVVGQVILAFSGLLVLALIVGLLSFYRLASSLDEREAASSRFLAESALNQLEKAERTYLLGHAVWQAAYDHLSGPVDVNWAYQQDNIGETLYSADGYEGVYVLDDSGTRYAMFEGQLSDVGLERRSTASARIIAQARRAAEQEQAASGFMVFDRRPALFSAAVIRPPVPVHHLPASQVVLVFIRVLDPSMLEALGQTVGLDGFAVSTAATSEAGRGVLPLKGSEHVLTWHIARPGAELVHMVIAPLAVAIVLIVLVTVIMARYAIRTSAGIDRSHQRLAASKAALETSEERFKAVAEAASDWIWETDAQLKVTYLSARFAELTGLTLSDWLQRPIDELLECETVQLQGWLHELAVSGAAGTLRCCYRDRTGQQRICRVSARAILLHRQCAGFRGTSTDITDEVAAHAQIQHLSMHDALTNLPNRNKLFRFLEQALQAEHAELAVVMLDLDNFKPINDNFGHPAGDAVLIEVATRLDQATRDGDLVARLGGDEFVIVLLRPGQRAELDRFCARIIESVRQPIIFDNQAMQVGASLGVALSREHGQASAELLRFADVALYSAKQAGKHTWRYFSEQMSASLMDKRALERELREGIGKGELLLHFQPRFRVDGICVASVEALVRWQHPRRGLLRPDLFIPLAEESDLIVLLGNWVLREACEKARDWPLEVMVSVNMSPAQFSRSDVVRDVHQALIASGLPAHRLELEITENVMLNDVEGALRTMQALKELGVRLNMDDFGTGYSSLGYLRTYPFDSIKIDKRFIQSLGKSDSDRSVVQAIINLGNAMGMTVTAEGVETTEQLELLSQDQCHEVQGFLLSHPVDNQALVRLMSEQQGQGRRDD
ncbi:EAL domain-containing protein [Pseudomonas fulva]|nr:EAL domain-containing protein [Pseudomonas fulva]MBF8780506.1 EAL domain-containing protein [Pseudomonas fulva]